MKGRNSCNRQGQTEKERCGKQKENFCYLEEPVWEGRQLVLTEVQLGKAAQSFQ